MRPEETVSAWKINSLAVLGRGSSIAAVLGFAKTVKEMEKNTREMRKMNVMIPLNDGTEAAAQYCRACDNGISLSALLPASAR